MGGPPNEAPATAPASAETDITTMNPVANPEDMSPEQRVEVYGHRYDYLDEQTGGRRVHRHHWTQEVEAAPTAGSPTYYASPRHHHRLHHRLEHRRWARGHAGWRRGRHGHWVAQPGHHHGSPAAAASAAPVHARHHPHHARVAPKPPATAPSTGTPAPAASSAPPAATPPAPAAPTAVQPAANSGSNFDWLSIPGAPYVNIPGIGRVASKFITAAGLVLLAVVLLALAARAGRGPGPRRRRPVETIGAGPAFNEDRERP
jgi:hypothetical protein